MADHSHSVWRCVACRGFLVLPSSRAISYKVEHPPPGHRWSRDRPEPHEVVCVGYRELVNRPAVLAAYMLGGPDAVSHMQDT